MSTIASRSDAGVYPRLASQDDVAALERTPLDARLGATDFARILEAGCLRVPQRHALAYVPDGDPAQAPETVTYAELLRRARQCANLFAARGIGRDDCIALVLPTLPETYVALLAAFFTGIVFPANWMLRPEHLARLLRAARTKAIVALGPTPGFAIWEGLQSVRDTLDAQLFSVPGPGGRALPDCDLARAYAAERGDALVDPRPRAPGAIAAYVHSGGTTGLPKLVRLTHRGLAYRRWATDCTLAHGPDEVVLSDTPLFHIGGLCARGLPPIAGGASVVIPSVLGARDQRFIASYWRFIERYRITRLSGVPTTLAVLVKNPPQGVDLGSLAPCFATGSTAVPLAVQRGIEAITGARALVMYGLTENTSNVTIDPRDGPIKEGCSGIRVPYTHIRIVRLAPDGTLGADCPAGETGMILVGGPGITPGYLDAELDRGAFADGWFVSGDLGRLDADGYLRVTGRRKDLILRGGHNIEPALIEEPLALLPDVLHAAAVGKPDAHAGEIPIAYVQLAPGSPATSESLLAAVADRIAERPAVPKEIVIVEAMPLSGVGKPLKTELRRDAAQRAIAAALAPWACTVEIDPEAVDAAGVIVRVADAAARAAVQAVLDTYTVPYRIVTGAYP